MDYKPNSPGRPIELTPELIDYIVSFIPLAFTGRQVSRLSKVPKSNISRWLSQGEDDASSSIDSIYAQFWVRFEEEKGKLISELLLNLKHQDSYQALSWLLENCFPEEYGSNSDNIKELISVVNKLAVKGE